MQNYQRHQKYHHPSVKKNLVSMIPCSACVQKCINRVLGSVKKEKIMDKRKEMHIRWTIRSSSGGLMLNVPRLMNDMILEAHRGDKSV